jgi:hypothetical protein
VAGSEGAAYRVSEIMREVGPSKLFHAIVGLGLAAVGCGGQILGQTSDSSPPKKDVNDAPSGDAEDAQLATEAGVDATTTFDAEVSDGDASTEIDAVMAHDAAVDVAREAWPIPPIK